MPFSSTAGTSTEAFVTMSAATCETRMAYRGSDGSTTRAMIFTAAGIACDTPSTGATGTMADPHCPAWTHPR